MMNEIYAMNTAPGYTHWQIVWLTWAHFLFLIIPGLIYAVNVWWHARKAASNNKTIVLPTRSARPRKRAA